MIEVIHTSIWAFLLAFGIYSFFDKREIVQIVQGVSTPLFLIYYMGYEIATQNYLGFGISLVLLLLMVAYVIWRLKKEPDERFYTREELITAQYIYDRNYIQDPEGFAQLRGTRKHAEVTINYLLGIIEGDGEKYKTMTYESKINGKKTALRTE